MLDEKPSFSETNRSQDKNSVTNTSSNINNICSIPSKLDKLFEKYDFNGAVHATTIKPAEYWKKESKSICEDTYTKWKLDADDLLVEKKEAFDLLDALSKSGDLELDYVDVHVVVGMSHWFDYSVMETLVEQNTNPIEKLEKSSLLVTSIICDELPRNLISDSLPRIK